MIQLKNVEKIYNNKVHALKNINLEVNKGDIYGIIGYSGAGKSTLIRLLNGLETATNGEVNVLGEDFGKISNEKRRLKRQKIGMIFQHFNLLWSRTVAENIEFPLEILGISKEERKKRVDELVKLVGLEDRKDNYPSQLSGGQKQRVGIARALAGKPEILLCDEATSALDPETTADVLDLINEIHKKTNITVVLITHEMHVVKTICTKVAVIDAGEIVEEGLVSDVFYKPKKEITKRFLKQTAFSSEKSAMKNIKNWKETFVNGQIVKLTFNDKNFNTPIISELTKSLDVKVNIIQGKIDRTQTGNIGTLYAQLLGETDNIEKTINKLEELEISVEVL
ncbi:methionine ABC transporter ATP-binding protein [Gemelliphila palaticanis]|uniref:ATP-binding cassette domain-containing protein n=1 Tax=Gemelliphila palaticanis TaxID=81950 RepID=A0ABX2SXC1_9BACL|nr:ATP-binding cassette domain-containing protein [Gemella palaticanis]MBF0714878.1 ATP-binding cassette domain-containing protein [Gemella palaticanis]NYS46808.1 ATP-binding cassette domain-containing protein [Gemella palaticanis]